MELKPSPVSRSRFAGGRPMAVLVTAALVLAALVAAPTAANADPDPEYTVSGTVTSDADDISGLIATLLRPVSDTETLTISTTNVDPTTGAFTLPGLSPDFSYQILITDPSGAFAPTYYSDEDGTDVYVGDANGTDYDVELAAGTFAAAGVSISGGTALGDLLTASASFSPAGTYSYQWLRNDVAIAGATAPTYAVTAADQGASISVVATATKRAVETASAESTEIAIPAGVKAFAQVKNPKISGKAKVGKVLKVAKVDWKTPSVKVTYRWYANGKLIKKATKSSLKLTKKLAGKKISVKITGTKVGYRTVVTSSKPTKKVKK